MNELEVYLWLMLDSIKILFLFLSSAVFFPTLFYAMEQDIVFDKRICWKPSALLFVPFFLIAFLIPSTKQFAVIKVLPAVVNSHVVETDIPELYDISKDYLKNNLQIK